MSDVCKIYVTMIANDLLELVCEFIVGLLLQFVNLVGTIEIVQIPRVDLEDSRQVLRHINQ